MAASPNVALEVSGRTVKVTNPDKVNFAARGEPKRVAPSRAKQPRKKQA